MSNNTNNSNTNNTNTKKTSKKYISRSFVIDSDVLIKLNKMAVEQDRSLNWLVRQILKEYCARM